jgi:hypothetical protein
MLIDDRPGPEPDPDPIHVDWRLCFWIALTLVLFVAAGAVPPLPGLAFALAGLAATLKVLVVATGGWSSGLRDWHQ